MRHLIGAGTGHRSRRAFLFVNYRDDSPAIVVLFLNDAGRGILVVIVATERT